MQLSLKQYAILLGAITIMIYSAFGYFTNYQIQAAKVKLAHWKSMTTKEELLNTIDSASAQGLKAAQKFSEWGEVRQQIQNPGFYGYWRDQRMMSADHLPSNAISANLYNASGESLLSIPPLFLPSRIDPQNPPAPYVIDVPEKGPLAVFIAPVTGQGGKSKMGFVAISIPFLPLITNGRFQHIQAESITLENKTDPIPLDIIFDYIGYQNKEDVSSSSVQTILTNTAQTLLIASMSIAVLLYVLLVYGIRRPLQQLIDHIHRLGKHPVEVHSYRFLKQLGVKELNEVGAALNTYQQELNSVYGSLDEKNKELLALAYTDPLTGIKNRRAFNDHWEQVARIADNSRLDISMMLFDIIHFKAINDSYGHKVGDEVLTVVAGLINSELRKGEHLYRLGGDEFGAVAINCNEAASLDIARRCIASVSRYDFKSFGIMEHVRISVGIACSSSGNKAELDNLAWQADSAIYLAKRPDSQDIVVFKPEMAKSSASLFSNYVYSAVFNAIETGEGLTIYYQPIIELSSAKTCYFESLVRIRYRDEVIPPGHIFPIITARNLDKEMDQAIVRAILDDLEHKRIPEGTGVSINLSGPSTGSSDLVSWLEPLASYLNDYTLVIEVTETTLITQMSKASENLKKLKKMGFLVALDDFGSGYSSLRYLGSMPVDIVKFDIFLINELNSPQQRLLIHHLCNMITAIGYKMVAEGIEDSDTHKQIILAGFDYGQGYLFGKPAEIELYIEPATATH